MFVNDLDSLRKAVYQRFKTTRRSLGHATSDPVIPSKGMMARRMDGAEAHLLGSKEFAILQLDVDMQRLFERGLLEFKPGCKFCCLLDRSILCEGALSFSTISVKISEEGDVALRHVRLQANGSSSVRMMYTSSPRKCCSKILFPRLAAKLGGQWFEVLLGLAILFSVQFKNCTCDSPSRSNVKFCSFGCNPWVHYQHKRRLKKKVSGAHDFGLCPMYT